MAASDTSDKIKAMWSSDNKDIGKYYGVAERIVGPAAAELLRKAGVLDFSGPLTVLDNACGTGIVTTVLMEQLSEAKKLEQLDKLTAADFSSVMLDVLRPQVEQKGWNKVEVIQADMTDMSQLSSDTYTHHLTNFGIFFPANSDAVLSEMKRVMKAGGAVAFSTWQTAGWMKITRSAVQRIPGAPTLPEDKALFTKIASGNAWDEPSWIRSQLEKHSFEDVDSSILTNHMSVAIQEYLQVFTGPMARSIISVFWAQEDVDKYFPQLPAAVEEYLKETYGDGNVEFDMVAVITAAKKPSA